MKMEKNNKSVFNRIMDKIKGAAGKVGKVLDDMGNPNKHIDNPTGEKYYEKDEYWKEREASEKNMGAPAGDKGIDRR